VLSRRMPLRRSAPPRRSAPLKRGLPPQRKVPVRKKRFQTRRGPERCAAYLAWIRTLGCAICSRSQGGVIVIEAAHTNALGSRGMSQKSSDFSAIPLCADHHRVNPDSYHRLGEKGFEHAHRIHLNHLIARLNSAYTTRTGNHPQSAQPTYGSI